MNRVGHGPENESPTPRHPLSVADAFSVEQRCALHNDKHAGNVSMFHMSPLVGQGACQTTAEITPRGQKTPSRQVAQRCIESGKVAAGVPRFDESTAHLLPE